MEKSEHTLQSCSACCTKHVLLTRSFPDKRSKRTLTKEDPVIMFNDQDLSSTADFGKKVLSELNVITEEKFKKPVEDVLSETPQSKLVVKLSSQEQQLKMRRTVRVTKKAIQQSMALELLWAIESVGESLTICENHQH